MSSCQLTVDNRIVKHLCEIPTGSPTGALNQTWPWVGFIHGLGWVGLGPKFSPMKWVGLGLVARN